MAPDFIGRVKRLILSPHAEWDAIEKESVDAQTLALTYVAPLAAVPVVAGFLGALVFSGAGFGAAFLAALISFVLMVIGVFVFAFLINALAPTFGAARNWPQALKLAAYAPTAGWLAGAFGIIPILSILSLLGGLFSLFLLYVGLPKLMKPASDKATTYTVVSILTAIVAGFMLTILVPRPPGDSAATRASARSEDRGGGRSEAAVLGPVVKTEAFRTLAPEKIAGLRRDQVSVESITAPFIARVLTASYGNSKKRVTLRITNSPAVDTMLGAAGYAGAEYDRSSNDGFQRLRHEDGAFILEEWSKLTRTGKIARTVGDAWLVEVDGRGVDYKALERAAKPYTDQRLRKLPIER